MRSFFILALVALNLLCLNHAMALSNLEQRVIFNDDGKSDEAEDNGKPDGGKGGETNPEDDCE